MIYKNVRDENGNKKYYECFSTTLMDFLEERGIFPDKDESGRFITYRHLDTRKRCYIYTMNEKLSCALKEWSNSKQ